ncbi:MAG: Maf family nucleotide pyrophosphatase [Bacteroidales bacterium]|nr:Maf family nucleotide pyrophosphatase [Bacteroidales bacterium]
MAVTHPHIILASQSPRRKMLLQGLGIDFEVKPSPADETYPADLNYEEVAEYIAKQKARHFPKDELPEHFILITADTVVCLDNEILGKPKDAADAIAILRKLSGRKHEVITGVVITTATAQNSFSDKTDVYFKDLTEAEIAYYVENYRPFDKAGAYGIQEWIGYIGITRIDGSFFNVMGLPVQRVYEELEKIFPLVN